MFGDSVIAAAFLDRLLHHSITVNIKGESYRIREKLKAGLLIDSRTSSGKNRHRVHGFGETLLSSVSEEARGCARAIPIALVTT